MSECRGEVCRPADVKYVLVPMLPGSGACFELVQCEDGGPFADCRDVRWSPERGPLWRSESGLLGYGPPDGNA